MGHSTEPMANRPNFFIVGFPKCGTTALSEYLRTHPRVFVTNPKEPFFFADDLPGLRTETTLDGYLRLFDSATSEEVARGEASPSYIISDVALHNIREFEPDARIIVMLRNPIDLYVSLHGQLLYALFENEHDPEKAWRLQQRRSRGESIPSTCREPVLLQYRRWLQVGSCVERALEIFPREQVQFVMFEELSESTAAVYERILKFIGVEPDDRAEFPRIHAASDHRSSMLYKLYVLAPQGLLRALGATLKKFLPLGDDFFTRWNKREVKRAPLTPRFREELLAELRPEIHRLEQILDRDLGSWTSRG